MRSLKRAQQRRANIEYLIAKGQYGFANQTNPDVPGRTWVGRIHPRGWYARVLRVRFALGDKNLKGVEP